MNKRIPNQVIAFAGPDNLKPYEQFVDLFNHYRAKNGASGLEYVTHRVLENGQSVPVSFDEKSNLMNATLLREILRVAGIGTLDEFPLATWATNPQLIWATFAVVGAMIDAVLPDTIIDSVGLFSDVRTIGWGDSASFDVASRDIFAVSKAGRSKRITELKKQFNGQYTVQTEPRQMTVFV